jgi:myo-inositol-1(or 4)-monophosphatase
MNGSDTERLLVFAKSLVRRTQPRLPAPPGAASLDWIESEPKATIDAALSEFLVSGLGQTGLPVLSEEGPQDVAWEAGPCWIVDPLDGTLNFVRGAGPSMVSVCLWDEGRPAFGVLLDNREGALLWGGEGLGAWRDDMPIAVSEVAETRKAVLCTGIPSGFDFNDDPLVQDWLRMLSRFGKVRMIGSAAASLTLVASGAADGYHENRIKVWDVAAGLALLQGAGGKYRMAGREGVLVDVAASNAVLFPVMADVSEGLQR